MFNLSCVLILPAALRDSGNSLSIALGHGPDTYSIPLVTGEVVTHYGAHVWVQPEFIATIQAASKGTLPAVLTALDKDSKPRMAKAVVDSVVTGLIISVREGGDPQEHWQAVLKENGLTVQEVKRPL